MGEIFASQCERSPKKAIRPSNYHDETKCPRGIVQKSENSMIPGEKMDKKE